MFRNIGITGDIHGDLNLTRIKKAIKEKYDCLIVTGDFGYIWDNSKMEIDALDKIEEMSITILFVSGNHENFNLLKEYPIKYWNGGKVQFIRKNIIHLLRGQVFSINEKKFFTFGGAKSIDKFMRKENIDWWKEEMPTLEEMNEGIDNLKECGNKINYIITHTCSDEILPQIVKFSESDELTRYFSFIKNNVDYDKWFFGHMHIDFHITKKDSCLYRNIIGLED